MHAQGAANPGGGEPAEALPALLSYLVSPQTLPGTAYSTSWTPGIGGVICHEAACDSLVKSSVDDCAELRLWWPPRPGRRHHEGDGEGDRARRYALPYSSRWRLSSTVITVGWYVSRVDSSAIMSDHRQRVAMSSPPTTGTNRSRGSSRARAAHPRTGHPLIIVARAGARRPRVPRRGCGTPAGC